MNNSPFTFKPIQRSDENMILSWLRQDYIQRWIHGKGLQSTLNGIANYFQGATTTIYWIGSHNASPFAFLTTSPEGNEAITLDVFICDANYLGKGLAVPLIHTFLLAQFPHAKRVLIDPEASNTRAIHVYKKAGFKIIGEFIASWHPVPHYQMELQMKDLNIPKQGNA